MFRCSREVYGCMKHWEISLHDTAWEGAGLGKRGEAGLSAARGDPQGRDGQEEWFLECLAQADGSQRLGTAWFQFLFFFFFGCWQELAWPWRDELGSSSKEKHLEAYSWLHSQLKILLKALYWFSNLAITGIWSQHQQVEAGGLEFQGHPQLHIKFEAAWATREPGSTTIKTTLTKRCFLYMNLCVLLSKTPLKIN